MSKVYRRDSAGISGVLNSSAIRGMVQGVTSQLAAAVDSQLSALPDAGGVNARATVLTTDRPHGVVGVPARFQASNGVLTRAAASMGLEVHP